MFGLIDASERFRDVHGLEKTNAQAFNSLRASDASMHQKTNQRCFW